MFIMKSFIACWNTNYGLSIMIINMDNIEMAKIMAK